MFELHHLLVLKNKTKKKNPQDYFPWNAKGVRRNDSFSHHSLVYDAKRCNVR